MKANAAGLERERAGLAQRLGAAEAALRELRDAKVRYTVLPTVFPRAFCCVKFSLCVVTRALHMA